MITACTYGGKLEEQFKFTCAQCLNGHRSGTCVHFSRVDDPHELVFFIDKRGRPKKSENRPPNSFYPNEIQFLLIKADLHHLENTCCPNSLNNASGPIQRFKCPKSCCSFSCPGSSSSRTVRFVLETAIIVPLFPDQTLGTQGSIKQYLSDFEAPVIIPEHRVSIRTLFEVKCSTKTKAAKSEKVNYKDTKEGRSINTNNRVTKAPILKHKSGKHHHTVASKRLPSQYNVVPYFREYSEPASPVSEALVTQPFQQKVPEPAPLYSSPGEEHYDIEYSNINPLIDINFTPLNAIPSLSSSLSSSSLSFLERQILELSVGTSDLLQLESRVLSLPQPGSETVRDSLLDITTSSINRTIGYTRPSNQEREENRIFKNFFTDVPLFSLNPIDPLEDSRKNRSTSLDHYFETIQARRTRNNESQ